jgi:hypothetical protein
MQTTTSLSNGARVAIAALGFLGLLAASMVVAIGGFTRTPRWSHVSTLVAGPPAYAVAGIFFALSVLACLVLLRSFKASPARQVLAAAAYVLAAAAIVLLVR